MIHLDILPSVSFCAIAYPTRSPAMPKTFEKVRATTSTPPPGGNGTIMRTGFAGKVCAKLLAAAKASNNADAAVWLMSFIV